MPIVQVIMNLVIVLILILGPFQLKSKSVELADLMTFIQYSSMLASGFATIMAIVNALPKCEVSASRIKEILDYEVQEEMPDSEAVKVSDPKGEIVFKDVSFGYSGADENVLHDINLVIPAGKTTAIVGATGSGKSTLLKLIPMFFDNRFEGNIFIDGVDTKKMKTHDIRDIISYAPQKANLFSGTVESNLKVAKPDADSEDIKKACDMACVTEFLEAKETDASLVLTQGGGNLSGGQRQRVSVARAFIRDASIYLLDDTFSALDFKTDAAVRKAMYRELAGKTIVVVAQRIATIMNADKIVVMDKGRIVAEGTHKEILDSCEIYKEIYETQTGLEDKEGRAS